MTSVLITRPLESATILAGKIKSLHCTPIIFPTIEIHPVSFNTQLNFNLFHQIIFVSRAAIIHFAAYIKSLPSHIKIFTMGEDSAGLIKELGWQSAIYPPLHFSREGLLDLPEMQNVSQTPLLIIEGENSNNLLADALKIRGATVTQLFVYKRVLPQPQSRPNVAEIDIIMATSEESLKNLVALLGPEVKQKTLLLSSQRLVNIAKNMDFSQKPVLAKNAGDSALLEALKTVA